MKRQESSHSGISIFIAFACAIGLGACSTGSQFRKSGVGEGYEIKDVGRQDQFEVKLNISPKENNRYTFMYALRAIGEECASRGYSHFYYADIDRLNLRGFCFKTEDRKGLNVQMRGEGELAGKPPFVVENTLEKKGTSLRPGDVITRIEGKELPNFGAFRGELLQAAVLGKTDVAIEFMREGKFQQTQESLVAVSTIGDKEVAKKILNFGPKHLESLREDIN